ncbi:MAG: hypothetical protein JMDDDDMK_03847 [Acidobacteria bacterium]|nr:hypothetical protein [Acidobacteriota bacterium]
MLDQFVGAINSGFGFRRARFRAAPQPFKLAPGELLQLLRFDGLPLFLFLLFFQIVAVISREGLRAPAINFEDAVCDSVEKVPVVSDEQQRAFEFGQVTFEPFDRFGVEMIGRLVQNQQVGLDDQAVSERDAFALAAGERLHSRAQV